MCRQRAARAADAEAVERDAFQATIDAWGPDLQASALEGLRAGDLVPATALRPLADPADAIRALRARRAQ